MIVAALDLENYKQYSGSHRIEFPEQGVVAITGPNGAGKTTLFEAIEWCLYCPRAIPQATVPPHGGIGRTTVRVTLQDMNDGLRYVIQRELRGSGTQAEVYLEDQPDLPLVQGTREVSRYVAKTLIGLSYGAFVSTFFTKQKELQFFGDRSATERRTEVGRLLGLEAVREAQKEIGEGRTAARSYAESLRSEHVRRLGDRDLDKEIELASQALEAADAREIEAERCAATAASDAERLRVNLEQIRDLQTRDAALGHELAELEGRAATSVARRDGAEAELARLEQRAAEGVPLAAEASGVERLVAEVSKLDERRERAREHQSLQEARHASSEKFAGIAQRLRQLVGEHHEAAAGLAGWTWSGTDSADPAQGAARLHSVARSLDPDATRVRVERLLDARRCCDAVADVEVTLASYRRLRENLSQERAELLVAGDPGQALAAAKDAILEARHAEKTAHQQLASARASREENERIARELRLHVDELVCPTCTRPLRPEEAGQLAAALDAEVRRIVETEAALSSVARDAAKRIEEAEREEAMARARLQNLTLLDERLADGAKLIVEADARHRQVMRVRQTALDAAGLEAVPTPESIEDARIVAARTQRIAELAGLLEQLGRDVQASRAAIEDSQSRIRDLGEIEYDASEHQSVADALRLARRAAAQVEQIDKELAHQQRYQQQCDSDTRELAAIASQREVTSRKRADLSFDPSAPRAAQDAEAAARLAANEEREAHGTARQAVRDAQAARERIVADQASLQRLIEDADRKTREADELQRMYDELGEFDQYVARHVGPLLAETTERLLDQVTEGKYGHVRFDENYGIEVFDGDEAFPLAGFSGGERDVVALCARLALSEIVGSAATRPPRFLVLDEVFGSLDSERRAQLLGALGALASVGHFQQMFIISHVDDVQQSPVMDEAWTIEDRDGVSHVVRPEMLTPSLA